MNQPIRYRHYFEIIIVGQGMATKIHTNAEPPRVGELVNLEHISQWKGSYRVVQVRHTYEDPPRTEEAIIEILLEKNEAETNWVTGEYGPPYPP